jgi:hypothetical protein
MDIPAAWHKVTLRGTGCPAIKVRPPIRAAAYGRNPMFKHGYNDGRATPTYGIDATVPRSERRGRRRLRTRHFTLAVAAAIAGAAVLPAGSASATSAALVPSTFSVVQQIRTIPRNVDPGEFIQVNCPAGTKAVAAGAFTQGGLRGVSIRDTPVEMAALDTAGAGPIGDTVVAVQATCAPNAQLADAHVITQTLRNHTRNPESTVTTNCPAGEIAIGGGALVLDPDGFRKPNTAITMFANAPANGGRSWKVTVKDLSNDRFNPDQISAKVRCIPGPRPGERTTLLKETVFPMVPRPGLTVAHADGYSICPSGTLPITGGAVITGNSPVGNVGLNTTLMVTNPASWFANADVEVDRGTPAALHVIVRCG